MTKIKTDNMFLFAMGVVIAICSMLSVPPLVTMWVFNFFAWLFGVQQIGYWTVFFVLLLGDILYLPFTFSGKKEGNEKETAGEMRL